MKSENEIIPLKPRRPKSREVSSRFLSPTSTPSLDTGIPSPNQALSPIGRKSTSTDTRKQQHRSLEDSSSIRGLWPSSSSSYSSTNKVGTLADHLGNERLRDFIERKSHGNSANSTTNNNNFDFSLSRQRSCSEFNRFENEKESTKENHRPSFGGSMRYTGKSHLPGKSSSSSSSNSSSSLNSLLTNNNDNINNFVPGRFSVDENLLCRISSSRRKSDSFTDNHNHDQSESKCSDISSATDFTKSPSLISSPKQPGIEVSSKYLHEIPSRSRRWTSDSNISNPVSADNSPRLKKFNIKKAIKRATSLTGYSSARSQWALSPGRSGSPPMSVENKAMPMSFSSLKPPTSPSRAKGVEKLLNLGLDLFKSKKSSSSLLGSYDLETVHQLRLLHNRLIQWRFANARADTVSVSLINQVEANLLCALDSLTKLQHSVIHKKIQLQKEKLELKLDSLLKSQIKLLETWGDIERQHLSAVSMTKECLHSVVCRVPLTEGAKVDLQSASVEFRHASNLTASIKSMLTTFSPSAEKTVSFLSELAEVVAQEKLLLEECLELFRTISELEIQERSLKCYIIQLELQQQHLQIEEE